MINNEPIKKFIIDQIYNNSIYCLNETYFTDEEFREHIDLWSCWYKGYVDSFHRYSVYNGIKHVPLSRKSLHMAKKICEDKADFLMNERLDINLEQQDASDTIDKILKSNKFRSKSNELVEKTQAVGTGAYVEFIDKHGKIQIDYLGAEHILPLEVVNGNIISCAFISSSIKNGKTTVYLNTHIKVYPIEDIESKEALERIEAQIPLDYEGYIIDNYEIYLKDKSYKETKSSKNNMPIMTNTSTPFFQIIKPAKNNNIVSYDNGLGISCFSNAIQQLESADIVYDSYVNEYILGKKRLVVKDKLAKITTTSSNGGNVIKPAFDTNDVLFYAFDLSDKSMESIDPALRIDEHDKGLNRMLNLLGFKCGMGTNYYKFQDGVIKTATEVISSNKELYNSIKKDQHILGEALVGLVKALLELSNKVNETKFNIEQDITIDFDDSIFQDRTTLIETAIKEYEKGLISVVDYYMKVYGMTKEQAILKKKELDEFN